MTHKRPKPRWQRSTLPMADNHTWQAPEGYKIFVIDRGLVSFNIPASWHIHKLDPPVEIRDQAPPDETARLMVSFWRLPPGVDWTGLPLAGMLKDATKDTHKHKILERGEIITHERTDLEIVWVRQKFLDPEEKRPAYSNIAVGRGWNVQILYTFDIWVEDLDKFAPNWDELLRSTQLGRVIDDPRKGMTLH